MINRGKIKALIEKVIDDYIINTSLLNDLGFNSHDIDEMIERGYLVRMKRGLYTFSDESLVYIYSYLNDKPYEKKNFKGFGKCVQINDRDVLALYNYMVCLIYKGEIENSFMCFKRALKLEDESTRDLNTIILNLYSFLGYELSDYSDRLNGLAKIESVKFKKISDLIINKDFIKVRDMITLSSLKNTVDYQVIHALTCRVLIHIKNNTGLLSTLIKEEKYNEILSITEDSKIDHEKMLNYLVRVYLDLFYRRDYFKVSECKSYSFNDLINANDFARALEFIKNDKGNNSYYVLAPMLKRILELKEKIKLNADVKVILSKLINGDREEIRLSIDDFLAFYNLEMYRDLVDYFIDLDKSFGLRDFNETTRLLGYLKDGKYNKDIYHYVKAFYEAIEFNLIDAAECYLNIVRWFKNTYHIDFDVYALEKALNEISHDKTVESIRKTPIENRTLEQKFIISNSDRDLNDEKNVIKAMIEELNECGSAATLPVESGKRASGLCVIANEYPDVTAYTVGPTDNLILVIKKAFRTLEEKDVDPKVLSYKASDYYKEGFYDEALKINLFLLSYSLYPYANLYARIGLCYEKMGNYSEAIKFLTLAQTKSLNETTSEKRFNFKRKINDLQKRMTKYRVRVLDKNFYAGDYIRDFDDIALYVNLSGLDVESCLKALNFDDEMICMTMLTYARRLYTYGYEIKADEYLKYVRGYQNKSSNVKKALEDLVRNRKVLISKRENACEKAEYVNGGMRIKPVGAN